MSSKILKRIEYTNALMDAEIKLVAPQGVAGTGKIMLALANLANDLL